MSAGRVLGVDLGSKRIGLALSDRSRTIASPHSLIVRGRHHADDHAAIRLVVVEEEVALVVVGMPTSLSGKIGPAARAAEVEMVELRQALGGVAIVVGHDERLTTVSAHRALGDAGVKGRDRRDKVDKVAAAVMLQHFLDVNAKTRR
jgi:putative holliday junction resolvase